ncbi:hypothetical protein GOP47_0024984 [Adiantum capillus-veneris]|uniref:Uncharacterized protein n=1 Tax=Adiantum capillus-veneris TaxID=13818 RepID=A0A9D4Z451_ADICA|nr:hypothetical protein GOP47_0024984 [Adiantum capillus-veneris]
MDANDDVANEHVINAHANVVSGESAAPRSEEHALVEITPARGLMMTSISGNAAAAADDMVSTSTWAPNPSTTARLKWCGCLASSPCSHFANYYNSSSSTQPQYCQYSYSSWLPNSGMHHPTSNYTGVRLHPIQQYLNSQHDLKKLSKLKAQIVAHPMYDQLLSAHVACLRVATPVDHLQTIEAQLSTNVHLVAARYKSFLGSDELIQCPEDKEKLDRFMANYIVFLHSFKEQLHEHVRVQAMDAVMSCWEIEKAFVSLTGVSPGEGSGTTMSDDEDDRVNTFVDNINSLDFLEGMDSLGLGPLLPTESERSLMERVRLELKSELKQGYKNRIADVREEILRKRRAGKLPSETTAILKKWWNAHSKWPYPTEDEKARLVQETGLELKQINNWFINQRKRNWHSHASTTSTNLPTKNEASTSGGQSSSNISLSLNCEGDKIQNHSQDASQPAMSSFGETL